MIKYLLSLLLLLPLGVTSAIKDTELSCLTRNVYYEASGESERGKLAVALVTLNRVDHPQFPGTICQVVYQRNQFSWTRMPQLRVDKKAWLLAESAAVKALNNREILGDFKATHFHNTKVNPRWKLKRLQKINNHVFYA